MANITERISKSGEVSYLIKVSLGYEVTGKQITKSKTWRPEPGMNPKQVKKELNKIATLFEASFERREISRRVKFRDLAEEWFMLVTQTKELNVSTIEHIGWNGEPLHPNTPYRWLHEFCDEQELAFKGLHAFCHAYATTAMTSNAIDMKTVSAVLGHSQTSTTLNIYAHAVAEVNAKAVDVVEDIYTRKRKEA